MKTGRYENIDEKVYHSGGETSKSKLDLFNKSPFHYLHNEKNKNPQKETKALRIGSAVHAAILEPEKFKLNYKCEPENKITTVAEIKNCLNNFCDPSEYKGLKKEELTNLLLSFDPSAPIWPSKNGNFLKKEEYDDVQNIKESISGHKIASKLLQNGTAEVSYYFEILKESCRARVDFERSDGILVDLKTCEDASLKGFQRSVAKYRYHVQDAFYQLAYFKVNKKMPKDFIFIAVEKTAPYAVGVYRLSKEDRILGEQEFMKNLKALIDCKRSTVFEGYNCEEVKEINLPDWYIKEVS